MVGAWLEVDESLIVNLVSFVTFLLALIIRAIFVQFVPATPQSGPPQSSPFVERFTTRHTMAKANYLLFLNVCRDTFLLLTLFWLLFKLLSFEQAEDQLDQISLSLLGWVNTWGWIPRFVATWSFGIIAWVCMDVVESRVQSRDVLDDDVLERTLWLTHLPTRNTLTGERFKLSNDEFVEVEEELEKQLTAEVTRMEQEAFHQQVNAFIAQVNGQTTPREESRTENGKPMRDTLTVGSRDEKKVIEHITVPPVVDELFAIKSSLRKSREQKRAVQHQRQEILKAVRGTRLASLQPMVERFFGALERRYAMKEQAQVVNLRRFGLPDNLKMTMSGSAFVTFRTAARRNVLLMRRPSLWASFWSDRSYTYWNFGQVPFASVTLRCQRAINPDDINWRNLHIQSSERWRRWILSECVMAVLLCVTVVPAMKYLPPWASSGRPLLLLLLNSMAVPAATSVIVKWIRPVRNSAGESLKMRLNFRFLMFTTVVLPFLVVVHDYPTIWSQTKYTIQHGIIDPIWNHNDSHAREAWLAEFSVLVQFGPEFRKDLCVFYLTYLVVGTFVVNGNELVQATSMVRQFFCWLTSVTPSDREASLKPPDFEWGFCYAWCLTVFLIGIWFSTVFPSLLPCVYLFFCVTQAVARANLNGGWYNLGPDDCEYTLQMLKYSRAIIASWWLITGVYIALSTESVPNTSLMIVAKGSWVLCAVAVVLWAFTVLNTHKRHYDKFIELPGSEKSGWLTCFEWCKSLWPKIMKLIFPAFLGESESCGKRFFVGLLMHLGRARCAPETSVSSVNVGRGGRRSSEPTVQPGRRRLKTILAPSSATPARKGHQLERSRSADPVTQSRHDAGRVEWSATGFVHSEVRRLRQSQDPGRS